MYEKCYQMRRSDPQAAVVLSVTGVWGPDGCSFWPDGCILVTEELHFIVSKLPRFILAQGFFLGLALESTIRSFSKLWMQRLQCLQEALRKEP